MWEAFVSVCMPYMQTFFLILRVDYKVNENALCKGYVCLCLSAAQYDLQNGWLILILFRYGRLH
jgi:hypothetical protein